MLTSLISLHPLSEYIQGIEFCGYRGVPKYVVLSLQEEAHKSMKK